MKAHVWCLNICTAIIYIMAWQARVNIWTPWSSLKEHDGMGSARPWLAAHHLFFLQLTLSHTTRHLPCTRVDTQPSYPHIITPYSDPLAIHRTWCSCHWPCVWGRWTWREMEEVQKPWKQDSRDSRICEPDLEISSQWACPLGCTDSSPHQRVWSEEVPRGALDRGLGGYSLPGFKKIFF